MSSWSTIGRSATALFLPQTTSILSQYKPEGAHSTLSNDQILLKFTVVIDIFMKSIPREFH